jgi:hypothetical protein
MPISSNHRMCGLLGRLLAMTSFLRTRRARSGLGAGRNKKAPRACRNTPRGHHSFPSAARRERCRVKRSVLRRSGRIKGSAADSLRFFRHSGTHLPRPRETGGDQLRQRGESGLGIRAAGALTLRSTRTARPDGSEHRRIVPWADEPRPRARTTPTMRPTSARPIRWPRHTRQGRPPGVRRSRNVRWGPAPGIEARLPWRPTSPVVRARSPPGPGLFRRQLAPGAAIPRDPP